VANIIRNAQESALEPDQFTCGEERDLHEAFLQVRQIVMGHIADGRYPVALIALAQLRKPVDAFFETVLVMAEEEKIRCNRLALLMEISTLFHDLADFSKIVTES
jgi:glycyl-tRNA synthetase beta chain